MRTYPKFAAFMQARLGSRRDTMHTRLAEYLGVHPSQITAYKEGQSPSLVRCIQIARFFGEDPEKIAAMVGKKHELSELRGLMEDLLRGELTSVGEAESLPAQIHIVGRADAGEVELALEYTDHGFPPGAAEEHLSLTADLSDPNAYALEIRGRSMEPLFSEGDRVIVSPSRPFVPGKLCVVRARGGKVWLRRVERHGDTYSLLSVNPAYPPVYLHARDVAWLHAVTSVRFR
jgi:SOS-response transcriptional repressor LexA